MPVLSALRQADRRSGISKPATHRGFRPCFPMHLLVVGHDLRTLQELAGHSDVSTTKIDTQVLNRGSHGVQSPTGSLFAAQRAEHRRSPTSSEAELLADLGACSNPRS